MISELRNKQGYRELSVKINDLIVKAGVVSGLGNAREILDAIKEGKSDLHFLEIMSCPGGCINGGGPGQNLLIRKAVKKRMNALYTIDRKEALNLSHRNSSVNELYSKFLENPGSHKAHELLHTTYHKKNRSDLGRILWKNLTEK